MTVELISITPDAEKTMAYIARVSNPSNQSNENFSGFYKILLICFMNLWHFVQNVAHLFAFFEKSSGTIL